MAQGECGNLFFPTSQGQIRADIDRTGALLHRSRERRLDLFFGASVDDDHLQPEARRCRLRTADISLRYEPVVRIDEHGNFFDTGDDFVQQLQFLGSEFAGDCRPPIYKQNFCA
jgi:hypothetical protein